MGLIDKILDTELEEKFFKRTIFISIIIILVIVLIVFLNKGLARPYVISQEAKTINNDEIVYGVDLVSTGNKTIAITGFAYKRGQHLKSFNNRFVIKNEQTKKMIVLPTEMVKREEFALVDANRFDCSNSGMYARVISLGIPKGLYQLFIEYKSDGENMVFDTGVMFNYER